MRVLFFRDHEISGLRLATAPSPAGRPGWPGKDLSAASPNKDAIVTARVDTGERQPFPDPLGIGEDDAGTLAVQPL